MTEEAQEKRATACKTAFGTWVRKENRLIHSSELRAFEAGYDVVLRSQWVRIVGPESLPEPGFWYSVTWFNNVEYCVCPAWYGSSGWLSDPDTKAAFSWEVIAWHEMPEYQEESKDAKAPDAK